MRSKGLEDTSSVAGSGFHRGQQMLVDAGMGLIHARVLGADQSVHELPVAAGEFFEP